MNDGLPYERAAEGHVSRPPSAGVPGSQHSEANAVAWQSWLSRPPHRASLSRLTDRMVPCAQTLLHPSRGRNRFPSEAVPIGPVPLGASAQLTILLLRFSFLVI